MNLNPELRHNAALPEYAGIILKQKVSQLLSETEFS